MADIREAYLLNTEPKLIETIKKQYAFQHVRIMPRVKIALRKAYKRTFLSLLYEAPKIGVLFITYCERQFK